MAAGPLLVVVDEDVVPGDGAHVEGVQRTEHPQERYSHQRYQKHVQTPPV